MCTAGNTVFFDKTALTRRVVDGTLAWPKEAEAARPMLDQPPHAVTHAELSMALTALTSNQVVWIGTNFKATDEPPTLEGVGDVAKRISQFSRDVQPCPDC